MMQAYHGKGHAADAPEVRAPSWPLKEQPLQKQSIGPPHPQTMSVANERSPQSERLSRDVRRNYYTSTRQQQEQQQREYQNAGPGGGGNHNFRTHVPQHHIPPSEPIYLDIDPSIYQPMTVDSSGHRSPLPSTEIEISSPNNAYVPRSRLRHLNGNVARPATPPNMFKTNSNGNGANRMNSQGYPYVSPYLSPTAKEYHVPGGMFQTNSPQPSYNSKQNYDTTPIVSTVQNDRYSNTANRNMIMFGDDYDLGSINTGMSQQELLQKRRDVKKRRDGKQGKKKKHKERIVNMPPRLLSMGSWDTSLITKKASTSNNKEGAQEIVRGTGGGQKKQGQWNILRKLTPTKEEEQGSTDLSTRESKENEPNLAVVEHISGRAQTPSDNHSIESSSFPLLSSNARQEFVEIQAGTGGTGYAFQRPLHAQQGNAPSHQHQPLTSQHSPQPGPQHTDIYQRQHGEELRQLEDHLRYLEDQHQQLEQEIQHRQQQQMPGNNVQDSRPRAVRFATLLARDMEELGPSDEEGTTKDSPISVAHFEAQEQDKSNSSFIEPKALFVNSCDKPKSILRRKNNSTLDSNGRYNSGYRGRVAVRPKFYDMNGREVSPIRSPSRHNNAQQSVYPVDPPESGEDVNSIPEHPDDKDVALLFDSETDIDIELLRREFDEDSGVISDAFIEAVAAIVLQTAIRRFLAILKVQRMRSGRSQAGGRNLSPSPTQTEGSLSQRAVASQDKSELDSQVQSRSTSTRTVVSEDPSSGQPTNQEDFFYDLAAIQIQCVFRGWWVRDSLNVDHYCVTLLQKFFRGFRARLEYEYDLYRITLVQALWRRKHATRKTRDLFQSICRFQAICRGCLVRQHHIPLREYPADDPEHLPVIRKERETNPKIQTETSRKQAFEKARMQRRRQLQQEKRRSKATGAKGPQSLEDAGLQQIASIIIQTYWRSYYGRACYLQYISDVIVLQSIARRWLVQQQRQKNRSAPINAGQSRNVEQPRPLNSSPNVAISQEFGSVELQNLSSVVCDESFQSSNKKTFHGGTDGSIPSVPFKMLPDDDPEEPPSLTPLKKPRNNEEKQHSPSYFNNVNRFGGMNRSVWSASGSSGQYAVASRSSDANEKGCGMPPGHWSGRNGCNGNNAFSSEDKWTEDRKNMSSSGDQEGDCKPRNRQQAEKSWKQPQASVDCTTPRSKGWNAEEEIEKEATRNLIMAWKQKDKANSFTIKPRTGV